MIAQFPPGLLVAGPYIQRTNVLPITTGLGIGTPVITRTLSFNVPMGGYVVGISGSAFEGSATSDPRFNWLVQVLRQNGQSIHSEMTPAWNVLTTGERPFNLSMGPWPLTPNETWTVRAQDTSLAGLNRIDVCFTVLERVERAPNGPEARAIRAAAALRARGRSRRRMGG